MTELETYIQQYFGVSHTEALNGISALFQFNSIQKGDYLLKTGKRCDQLHFIRSGLLRIYAKDEDKEVTQWISTKGYFSTDLSSFIFDVPARWNIQALTDTDLFSISKTDYRKIGTIVPQWPELEKLFLVKCFTILEDRIFSHLSMLAEERYQLFFDKNPELFNLVPLQYIASMLGMTPETFSRIRKKQVP
jgi:CRP/FNR family transcriptional regulator, anaerobic regulatory protein